MTSDRLSVIDEIFLRTHRGYGLPNVLQGVLRSDDVIARVELAAVHANLAMGRLGRRVVTPSFPGARKRWVPSTDTLPLIFDDGSIPDSDVLDWADSQGDIELDPEHGPGWRLSAARTDIGGTVVSIVCSHALADATGLILATSDAFTGTAAQSFSRRTSDLADAVKLGATVTAGSLRAIKGLVLDAESRRHLIDFVKTPAPTEPRETSISTAVFEIDRMPSNSEFIRVVCDIAAELGHGTPVSVNVPFRSDVPGANGIGMATVDVSNTDSISDIKSACKRAFAHPVGAPAGFPAETVQLLPDHLAASWTASAGRGNVLCSNIGRLPATVTTLGPHPITSIATRALHPGAREATSGPSLSAYLASTQDTCTLSLVGTDRALASTSDELRRAADAVLARRQFDARSWR